MLNFNEESLPTNFCSAPWLQMHTEPDGAITPCCYFNSKKPLGDWNSSTLEEIYNGEHWKNLRKQFINNERPDVCTQCWKEEAAGVSSARTRFNSMYSKPMSTTIKTSYNKIAEIIDYSNADGTVNSELSLSTVDLIFNNLCNYKCRSCGPRYSTSWMADSKKIYAIENNLPYVNNSNNTLLDNSEITHLTEDLEYLISRLDANSEVHFSGGEPMMQRDHYAFLKMLIKSGNTGIRIRYNTNLSLHRLNDDNVFDLLKNFSNVFIVGSIDAMGQQGEYIRHGFDWTTALGWLDMAVAELPKATFGINTVYSLLNSYAAIDLQQHMLSQEKFKKFGFYINHLHGPKHLKLTVLPKEIKNEVSKKIKDHIAWLGMPGNTGYYRSIRNISIQHWEESHTFMHSSDDSDRICEFFKSTRIIDSVRGEDFETTFPEFYEKLRRYDN